MRFMQDKNQMVLYFQDETFPRFLQKIRVQENGPGTADAYTRPLIWCNLLLYKTLEKKTLFCFCCFCCFIALLFESWSWGHLWDNLSFYRMFMKLLNTSFLFFSSGFDHHFAGLLQQKQQK